MAQKQQPTLLEHAVNGASEASQLATGLAHAGADPKIVQQIQQCATLLHEVAKALGSGPSLDQNQTSGAPAPQGPPPNQGQPQAAPATAPAPSKKQTAHHAMLAAAHATQAAMAASGKNQK